MFMSKFYMDKIITAYLDCSRWVLRIFSEFMHWYYFINTTVKIKIKKLIKSTELAYIVRTYYNFMTLI